MDDFIVNASATLMEKSRYAGKEQYHGMYVVPRTDSSEHNMFAPIANAVIPIMLARKESPRIFSPIFQSLVRYSSLYLNMKDKKKPKSSPMVRKAEVFPIHSVVKSGSPSLGV